MPYHYAADKGEQDKILPRCRPLHFTAKEEILDTMIDRMTKQLVEKSKEIVSQKSMSVLQRLTMMMPALNLCGGNLGHKIPEQVHKTQNALMHQKMQDRLLSGINPLITSLIEECITQGICQTDYPAEVVEMTLLYYKKEARGGQSPCFFHIL